MTYETSFQSRLKAQLPLSIGDYMAMCNEHYYTSRDPLGADGDFTTAPEISQMFGELIGMWIADYWIKLGEPSSFTLLECGAGRGTLMADILRTFKFVPGVSEAVEIVLLETSEALIHKQKNNLQGFEIKHISSIHEFEGEGPVIIIGNEFLDALPIDHYEFIDGKWRQKQIVFEGDSYVFVNDGEDYTSDLELYLEARTEPSEGDMLEVSPAREAFMQECSKIIKKQGGALLFIDYGYVQPAFGESFQALQNHKFVDVLHETGECDLTSHVDFFTLKEVMKEEGLDVYGAVTQGEFLNRLGLQIRADRLKSNATPDEARDIDLAFHRLSGVREMGQLFKVIAGVSHGTPPPEGFND